MIKEKEKVHFHGQMGGNILESGKVENNMEWVLILVIKVKESKVSGKMAKRLDGLINKINEDNYIIS